MTFSLVLALITASVPCDPFTTVLRPSSQPMPLEAAGWTPDGRLIAVSNHLFFHADVFARELRWVADSRSHGNCAIAPLCNSLTGPEGVFLQHQRLLDATGAPLTKVDSTLRADLERWPRLVPHAYVAGRVALSNAGEWLIVAYPKHRSFTDYRVFYGRSPRIEEHPLQQIGMGLDGGSVGLTIALQGQFVHFSFSPTSIAKHRLEVNVGPTRVERFVEVPRESVPSKVRFTCVEPLPHDRWWPEAPPN